MSEHVVGRVAELWRYPVKSMGGESLEAADVSWSGIAGDRRWAFVREGLERSGFPWLTIRERPEMWHYSPYFEDPSKPDASRTLVRTPSGVELDVVDPALGEELGHGARVIKHDVGLFDIMPLSLITTRTIAGIGELAGTEALGVRRFRPNLLVEPAGDDPFPEDGWVGSVLRIGGVRMRLDQRDKRCVLINVDPDTTERNPAVLRAVAKNRDARVGVYGTTVEPGRIAVGDEVVLEVDR